MIGAVAGRRSRNRSAGFGSDSRRGTSERSSRSSRCWASECSRAITRRFDRELDASLREATRELIRVARLRDTRGGAQAGVLFDPVRDVRIPERDALRRRHARATPAASRSMIGCASWRGTPHVAGRSTRFIALAANGFFARTPRPSRFRIGNAASQSPSPTKSSWRIATRLSSRRLARRRLQPSSWWLSEAGCSLESPRARWRKRSRTCAVSWPMRRTSFARRSPCVRSRAEVALQRPREPRGVCGGVARNRARDDTARTHRRGSSDPRPRRRRRAPHRATARVSRRRCARRGRSRAGDRRSQVRAPRGR